MKLLFALLFGLLFQIPIHAQAWKYPYQLSGIDHYTITHPYKAPAKRIEIDSADGFVSTNYCEYDKINHLLIKGTSEGDNDTIYYHYDKFGDEILRTIQSTNDSIKTLIERTKDGKITKRTFIREEIKPNETSYEYDKKGRVTAIYSNGKLYDKLIYDKKRLVSVENYRHKDGGLSEIINYSYNGDTVSYEECSYDINGERYKWPCEKTAGVLNKRGEVEKIFYTYFNSNDGKYEEALSTTLFDYDKSGKILRITSNTIAGPVSVVNYYYDEDGFTKSIEVLNNGVLIAWTRYIIVEK